MPLQLDPELTDCTARAANQSEEDEKGLHEQVLDARGDEIPDVKKQQVAEEKQELERKFSCLSEEVHHGLGHGLVSWEWVTVRLSSGPLGGGGGGNGRRRNNDESTG